ncbi:MAG: hypothetical protein ACRC92_15300 [Peptostreptococcaceae bacterium]
MKKLGLFLSFVLFMVVSVVASADIFVKNDAIRVGTAIETTKGMSGVLSAEYVITADKLLLFDKDAPANPYPVPPGSSNNRSIVVEGNKTYLTNLEFGFGIQTRFMSDGYHNHQAYYTTIGYTFPIEHDYKYLPVAIRPVVRIGMASDLDAPGGGFYAGGGADFFFTENWYATVLFESEDKEYRNTFGVGYKFESLPFYK